ncbi:DUF6221 family protein [Glycomyces sp. A-F 0318]|uniref:DUF6221 family protein n=1 Tax=Glycomyces amatae TaxID=2881355 RepID=UPI001E4AD5E8|nr:DUF6221 family protein [Glycomyces amatae]MCD0446328.1 DUF6221 family protein [Glycomyces amatae]
MDIEAFVRARIEEDAAWARACSVPPAEDDAEIPAGVHWEWTTAPEGTAVRLPTLPFDDVGASLKAPGTLVWLSTKEKWPREDEDGTYEASGAYAEGIHLMDAAAAAHIARHHPARVLLEAQAKLALLEMVLADQNVNGGQNSPQWNQVMRLLALPYRKHKDYRQAWAPR